MRRTVLFVTVLLLMASVVESKKVATTRRSLRVASVVEEPKPVDSLYIPEITVPADSDIVVAGFDKPLASLNETMFISNRLDAGIAALYLTLDYSDRSGRQLHKRSCRVAADVPSGQTRQISIPSWDRQKSFYYIKSRKPRAVATAFDVRCRVDSVELSIREQ